MHRPPWWFHTAAAAWIAGVFLLARVAPATYEAAMQEDRATEWLTAALFIAAAAVNGARAVRDRRVGDGLVALFCTAAAGEEISWGQRLLGYTPPDLFLAQNAQQEVNLHNLVEPFGQPKWTLIAILCAYGIAVPLLLRLAVPGRLAARLRLAAPPLSLMPWFATAVALLVTYPLRFTGEWVEALSGGLFLAGARPSPTTLWRSALAGALFSLTMERTGFAGAVERTGFAGAQMADPRACATAELSALAAGLTNSPLARPGRRVHRRLRTLARSRAGPEDLLQPLRAVQCPGEAPRSADLRHTYGIDPWGTAYWVRRSGTKRTVYSFGPDRRRDTHAGGDDIAVSFGAGGNITR